MVTFLHAADIHLDSPLRKLELYEGAPVEALHCRRLGFGNRLSSRRSRAAGDRAEQGRKCSHG